MVQSTSGRSFSSIAGSAATSSSPSAKSEPPLSPAEEALRRSASDAAAALASASRGAAFYAADHPVAQQQRRELYDAVKVWQANAGGEVALAAAGETLLLTGLDTGVSNDAARGVCNSLIAKSVVGVRINTAITLKELGSFAAALGENERRVRAAGGLKKLLAERSVKNVDVTELNLDELLQGSAIDPAGLPPLIAKALTEVLALKARADRRGSAVALTLDKVDSPGSLGSLLDDLIDGAAPGVANPNEPTQRKRPITSVDGSLTGMNADELADLCADAYGKVTSQQQTPEALTEAANVLSSALVRLSPAARFKLLQKIANTSNSAAAEAVGKQVPNPMLMSALAQVVMGGERDSKLATAIGGLLERMRPLERDRQRLLDELDETARRGGRPLDGLFLQELNEISKKTTFGALDLPFRETKDGLTHAARLRQTVRAQPDIVARTYQSLRPENRVTRTARLLKSMLEQERVVAPATLASVRTLLSLSAADPSLRGAGGDVIHALWLRALRDGPASPAARQLADFATSENGPDWCVALLEQLRSLRGADTAMLLCDFVKSVLAVHQGETFRRQLVDALHALDRSVTRVLERRIAEFSVPGVNTLIVRAGRDSNQAALALAQVALRAPSVDLKEAALRALVPFCEEPAIAFLRRASGLDGEQPSIQALNAQKETPASVFRLQRASVEALGACKSTLAVPALQELLLRTRLVGGADLDRMRSFAARALAQNNTREARAVLDDGKSSRNRAVRLACGGIA
ncbi:MAG TPA: hypothetical protein VGO62_18690 [Myxococcota bacterium]|jgi:hypothetical protein